MRIELAAGQALPHGCADGRVAEWDSSTSRWICGIDNDTTYTDGTGLHLSAGNAFSISTDYRVKNTPDCSSGQFATGFEGDGDIQCAAPPAQGVQVWQKTRATDGTVVVALPKGEGVEPHHHAAARGHVSRHGGRHRGRPKWNRTRRRGG